ncbi:putative clp-type ATP-dependent chaperone protein [Burkholderia mallei]|nr:putative clp-type ATP-dependent chaperone protein [Burkholderia mallei]
MTDVLLRRRQNNPLLTGEAGVGKTAVVEGLALAIANGDVPPKLADVRLMSVDVGALLAGAGMKGEFESRLKGVRLLTNPTFFVSVGFCLSGIRIAGSPRAGSRSCSANRSPDAAACARSANRDPLAPFSASAPAASQSS